MTGNEVDGGILGGALVLAYAGPLLWIVGASLTMLRRPELVRPAAGQREVTA